ncbi:hypothetical protein [Winogradskyella sp. 3972H.M.0a.05]|uniref:hypothetical protein n=1 Tax=Winogradskyella sp. 3972H.M.0a.05 TaxID=2950277 RepID=UPI0033936084
MNTKQLLFTLIGLSAFKINAQNWKGSLETQSGYEFNILKNPKTLEIEDELMNRDDLWQNSFYQDVNGYVSYTYKASKNKLRWNASTRNRLYFEQQDFNRYKFTTALNYQFKSSEVGHTRWETDLEFQIKEQNIINNDEAFLRTPFSYKRYTLTTGLHFRPIKQNRTYLEVGFIHKDYDPTETRDFQYNALTAMLETKNVFWSNHKLHKYGVILNYQNRIYDERSLTGANITNRKWQYISGTAFYEFPITKQWSVEPEFSIMKRNDNTTQGNASYFQWSPTLSTSYKTGDWKLKARVGYRNRVYNDLQANTNEGLLTENIQYDYFTAYVDLERRLNKNLFLTLTASSINRDSNQTAVTSTAFRSYENHYIGLGLKWGF